MFYVIEISKGDSKVQGKSIYEFKTLKEARASFFKKYGTALGSELYTNEMILLVDSNGTIYNVEHYEGE